MGGCQPLDVPVKWTREYNLNLFIGACWAEGLKRNTPMAVAIGMQGLVCAPIHYLAGRARVEDWMYDIFEKSQTYWIKNWRRERWISNTK